MSLSSRKVPEIPNAQFSSESQTGALQLLERMYFDNWRYGGKQNPVILIISGLLIDLPSPSFFTFVTPPLRAKCWDFVRRQSFVTAPAAGTDAVLPRQ